MMRASWVLISLLAATSVQADPVPPDRPPLIRLASQSTAKPARAFRYRLLPDPLDRVPGNAAPLWRLAGDAYREANAKQKMTSAQFDWAGQTALKDLPRKEVRELLDHFSPAFRMARRAACRTYCDWQIPPLTLQTIQESIPFVTVVNYRPLASLIGIRFRLQLIERHFDDAAETLQIGFALARDLGDSDTFVQHCYGSTIAAKMLLRVEEWLQTPGSPNLYWALTDLSGKIGNARRSLEHELNTVYRSFPRLRRLRHEMLTERQVGNVTKEMFDALSKAMGNDAKAELFRKLGESIRKAERYPQARRYLLDLGHAAKEIDAMPKTQVVLLWHLDRYDRVRDDLLAALALPAWQGMPRMDRAIKDVRDSDNPTLSLLGLGLAGIYEEYLRNERQLAGLRGAEALRGYAAAHEGKPPAKWADITEVPPPIDPETGKGFEAMYQLKEGRGVLEVLPPRGRFVFLGRRYELAPPR